MRFIPHTGSRLALPLLGCGMLAALFSNVSLAQRDNPYASLRLFAKVDKDSYVVGEPVYLTVQLRNTGSNPVRVFKRLEPDDGFIIVHLTAPDGGPAGFAPLGVNDTAAQLEELRPGAEVGAVFPLFYGAMGWTFPRPGTYKAIVIYRLPRPKQEPEETKSEALTINVSQDKTGAGTFLLERGPAATEAGKVLLWESGDHLRRGIGRLESLIEKFPDSPLPDYARFALGRSLSRPFKDYSIGRLRPPDYQKSLSYLSKVRDEVIPPYLQIQKNLAMAMDYIGLKKYKLAEEALAKARRLIADRSEFQVFLEQVDRAQQVMKP